MPSTLTAKSRMTLLCQSFPTLRGAPGASPWEQRKFAQWASGPARTSGSSHAAAFVLGVWNGCCFELGDEPAWFQTKPYSVRVFDPVAALAAWDEAHASAFIRWCMDPFYP